MGSVEGALLWRMELDHTHTHTHEQHVVVQSCNGISWRMRCECVLLNREIKHYYYCCNPDTIYIFHIFSAITIITIENSTYRYVLYSVSHFSSLFFFVVDHFVRSFWVGFALECCSVDVLCMQHTHRPIFMLVRHTTSTAEDEWKKLTVFFLRREQRRHNGNAV